MKIFGSRFVMVAGLAGAAGLLFNVNCGSSGGDNGTGGSGTGGAATGTGGTHTGGTTGTGGSGTGGTHTGGTTGTGGNATGGAAGSSATGGTAGSSANGGAGGGAGASATGGTAGGGAGTSGSAGNGGVGGAIVGTALATFDPADGSADLDGFAINIYNNGAGSLDVATDASPAATLGWSSTQGDPTPGALVIDAPFHAYKELVDVQKGFATTSLQDWTGKTTLHVRVKVASGLNSNPSYPAGIQPYVSSYTAADGGNGTYNFCGNYTSVPAGNGWTEYTVSLVPSSTHCTGFDVSKVVNFGIEIQTGDGAAADAGQPAAPTAAVIYADSFSVE